MASTTLEVSSGYISYGTRLELILQSTSNGASANTSTVKYWLRFTKKYSADGSYAYTNGNHVYLKDIEDGDPFANFKIYIYTRNNQSEYVYLGYIATVEPYNDAYETFIGFFDKK